MKTTLRIINSLNFSSLFYDIKKSHFGWSLILKINKINIFDFLANVDIPKEKIVSKDNFSYY
jgi:hypothetical protein